MTDKTPAMPELPEPTKAGHLISSCPVYQDIEVKRFQREAFEAGRAHALAALQSAQPAAAVSDEETQADRLEAALESLVNLCNNDLVLCNSPEVIAAEATLERLYRARTTPKDATVTTQPPIPEACQFEPQTAPEAFLQQEMAKLRPQAVPMTDDPEWIVNDLGELGVRVGSRFFFLYKGDNIEYGTDGIGDSRDGVALHDDGTPMHFRIVGKREFGETCWPLQWVVRGHSESRYTEPLTFIPGLSWGTPEDGEWKPLPAHGITQRADGGEVK